MPDIRLEDLTVGYKSKKYGDVYALSGVNALFESGTLTAVIGYSGSGKTTLLRCVAGLADYEGRVLFDDGDMRAVKPHERNLSFVPQDYVLYSHMTVFDNIAFPLKNVGATRKEIIERVGQVAETLDLTYCLNKLPRHVSGGQQQRTAIARALVKNPSVCLLDEPLSNVDAPARARERRFIREALKKYGCTSIYVTHDLTEAMAVSDRILVLADGKGVCFGEPNAVYNSGNAVVDSIKGEDNF